MAPNLQLGHQPHPGIRAPRSETVIPLNECAVCVRVAMPVLVCLAFHVLLIGCYGNTI